MKNIFRKVGDSISQITKPTKVMTMNAANARIQELEQQLGTKPTATSTTPKVESVSRSTDNKVQAIFDKENNASLAREQALTAYSALSPKAKGLMTGKDITSENVEHARKYAEVYERYESGGYGNQIKLADWNKGIDYVAIRMNEIDTAFAESRARNEQARKEIQSQYTFAPGVSNVSPVYLVDQGYYLLWDANRVFCQSDSPDEKYPFMLAQLNGGSRGSQTVMVSGGNYDYLGFDDYKALLESRPSYESIRKAYLAIRNDRLQMDFSKAEKLFG
jgi:hypothetical protein